MDGYLNDKSLFKMRYYSIELFKISLSNTHVKKMTFSAWKN